jgi:F-type H+-transporting ATPase subunit epsilon
MSATDTFECSVITPERKVLECQARFVAFPAHDGEIGILSHRAPLVCKLGIGILRVEAAETGGADAQQAGSRPGRHVLFIDGGFAEVVGSHLTILTQQARAPEDIDATLAEQALVEARARKITDDASCQARTDAIHRARVQLKLARPGA